MVNLVQHSNRVASPWHQAHVLINLRPEIRQGPGEVLSAGLDITNDKYAFSCLAAPPVSRETAKIGQVPRAARMTTLADSSHSINASGMAILNYTLRLMVILACQADNESS
ncbi:hypothetical protein FHL15_003861 [Xylaria flabelliformis]|uniref:Uncharacterized protein n=1 Tax=Xylaria flabelliformis TaxID=2512241 RepID=A0A553I4N4_9PEZI|nr:hypothetical protein FHL15_003861 [Xylaria flabelliformis]